MNDMLLCLMPLRLVSIGLLLNKGMNYLMRPIDGNRAFSKGHWKYFHVRFLTKQQITMMDKHLKKINIVSGSAQ